jgi:hypothetical protein
VLPELLNSADTVESVPQAHKLVAQEVPLYLCISSLEDGGRPTGVCCRRPASNYLKLLALRVLVVSVEEKGSQTDYQVWYRETATTKNILQVFETMGFIHFQELQLPPKLPPI